jgi:hypothetical protein
MTTKLDMEQRAILLEHVLTIACAIDNTFGYKVSHPSPIEAIAIV